MPSGHWCIVGKKLQLKRQESILLHAHHVFHIIKSEVTNTLCSVSHTSIAL